MCYFFFIIIFKFYLRSSLIISSQGTVPKLFSDSRTVEEDSLLSSVFCQDLNSGNFHSRA